MLATQLLARFHFLFMGGDHMCCEVGVLFFIFLAAFKSLTLKLNEFPEGVASILLGCIVWQIVAI